MVGKVVAVVAVVLLTVVAWLAVPVVATVGADALAQSNTFFYCAERDYNREALPFPHNVRCEALRFSYVGLRSLAHDASAQTYVPNDRWAVDGATWLGAAPVDGGSLYCGLFRGGSDRWCATYNLYADDAIGTERVSYVSQVIFTAAPLDDSGDDISQKGNIRCRLIGGAWWACSWAETQDSYTLTLADASGRYVSLWLTCVAFPGEGAGECRLQNGPTNSGQLPTAPAPTATQPAPTAQPTQAAPAPSATPAGPAPMVRINHATAEELDTLPRVGPAMAAKIIAARPLRSCQDADERVSGWGPVMVAETCPLVDWSE